MSSPQSNLHSPLPPPAHLSSSTTKAKFNKRSHEEEIKIQRKYLDDGIDQEDINFFKNAFTELTTAPKPFESHDALTSVFKILKSIKWTDHCPTVNVFGADPEEEHIYYLNNAYTNSSNKHSDSLKSISMRTLSFNKLTNQEKFKQYATNQHQQELILAKNISDERTGFASIGKQHSNSMGFNSLFLDQESTTRSKNKNLLNDDSLGGNTQNCFNKNVDSYLNQSGSSLCANENSATNSVNSSVISSSSCSNSSSSSSSSSSSGAVGLATCRDSVAAISAREARSSQRRLTATNEIHEFLKFSQLKVEIFFK